MSRREITPGRWHVARPGGPQGPFWSIVADGGRVVAPQIATEADARAMAEWVPRAENMAALVVAARRLASRLDMVLEAFNKTTTGDPTEVPMALIAGDLAELRDILARLEKPTT